MVYVTDVDVIGYVRVVAPFMRARIYPMGSVVWRSVGWKRDEGRGVYVERVHYGTQYLLCVSVRCDFLLYISGGCFLLPLLYFICFVCVYAP